ncbi:uncharacterized protein BDR25DRAFT_284127 [Lindgomyces ingoldianus]|uniref:Uncharacterized protein n=1 Tax=Lindgomyces ingoldianus TaxID=673940 RepID=A0ACB6R007_9PLEO|nr:uncharacterized protein BDR25DRAFT_284127 [Lindgomyces ingoldianus]KAF2472588.1 hypothetical protein BDR25DRAFT_284127 [Lindgomyces ingoldianus]
MARISIRRANTFSMVLSTSWVGILFIVLLFNTRTASARALPDISDHINNMFGTPNRTAGPVGEIQCYALPYGAIGIISHLLTYWTIAWIGVGRSPVWPWHRLTSTKFDIFLASVTLVTCIPIASISIHRCRLSWHFVLIGVWKLVTSVSLACITIHRAVISHREAKASSDGAMLLSNTSHQYTPYHPYGSPQPSQMYTQHNTTRTTFFSDPNDPNDTPSSTNHNPLYWLTLYLLGTVTGMVGLGALIYTSFRHNKDVRNLTYGFAIAIAIIPMITAAYWYKKHLGLPQRGFKTLWEAYKHTFGGALLAFIAVFGFFSALYSDLALGAIAGKWSGVPSEDYAPLYWAWFVAKRLTMLSH